jgi:Zn-dependent M28 family amino/carboxypeptidase
VVFAFWTGEEEGHIGSGHYVRNPLWPLSRTPVYVNLDMIGHPWTMKEIEKLVSDAPFEGSAQFLSRVKAPDFAEPGVADWAPELAPVLELAGKATGLDLHFDWTDGQFGGSDYREFARLRIPFIRFFGNFFPGYHEPIDTPEKLDFVQTQKLARLAGATVWLLADR